MLSCPFLLRHWAQGRTMASARSYCTSPSTHQHKILDDTSTSLTRTPRIPNTTQHQIPTQLLTSTTPYSSPQQKHNHVRLKHLQHWSGSGCNEPLSQYPNLCFHEVTAPSSLSIGTTSASFRITSLFSIPWRTWDLTRAMEEQGGRLNRGWQVRRQATFL